jgi:hypothetical protein
MNDTPKKGMSAINALTKQRKAARVSQASIAKAMGWTTGRVFNLEHHYLYASEEYVAQYAAALASLTTEPTGAP